MRLSLSLLAGCALAKDTKTEKLVKYGAEVMRETSLAFIEVEGNSVVSPLSIMGAMYLTAACTKPGSNSERQIIDNLWSTEPVAKKGSDVGMEPYNAFRNVEKFMSNEGDGYTLKIANGVFFQEGAVNIDRAKKSQPMNYFEKGDATIKAVDFQSDMDSAIDEINDWVDKTTNGKIDKLFESLDPETILALTSSLYFKSEWKNSFKPLGNNQVMQENLCWKSHPSDVCAEEVEWMQHTTKYPYKELKDPQLGISMEIFEVPLGYKKFSDKDVNDDAEMRNQMYVQFWMLKDGYLFDDADENDNDQKVQEFIKKHIGGIRSGRNALKRRELRLSLPKLSLETEVNLVEEMEELGIKDIFDSSLADFSPILGEDDNRGAIGEIKHKVKFDMDETGVEGAAVTASILTSRTISQPKPVRVERPFYFFVTNRCHNSKQASNKGCAIANIPIFAGRVVDPAAQI